MPHDTPAPSPPAHLPKSLGDLRRGGHSQKSVKDELRANLVRALRDRAAAGKAAKGAATAAPASPPPLFPGIVGYDETVLPAVQNAILSRHDFLLLGLRGQAKTRILRSLTALLDEWTPVIPGCPLNSHPLAPLSAEAKAAVRRRGDDLEIGWLHRSERYREKLATPDITIADLIGDVDPIKAATRKLDLGSEEAIHFGIVPRTHRGIFAINELPDLPTRIQVGLLNILEERDVQIRGFPVRLPIDVLLVFTANPEDYTNRGSIITPLKDRIESQIHTHYPLTLEDGLRITAQEAWLERADGPKASLPRYLREVVEETAIQARTSSFVDQNSGVSARVTIALAENAVSNAERRALRFGRDEAMPRVSDLFAAVPALTGKIELVYEGEQEGAQNVARALIGKAVKAVFDREFPDPYREDGGAKVYEAVQKWFRDGHRVTLAESKPPEDWLAELSRVPDLEALARNFFPGVEGDALAAAMEFVLEGLHQSSILNKETTLEGSTFGDAFDAMVKGFAGE